MQEDRKMEHVKQILFCENYYYKHSIRALNTWLLLKLCTQAHLIPPLWTGFIIFLIKLTWVSSKKPTPRTQCIFCKIFKVWSAFSIRCFHHHTDRYRQKLAICWSVSGCVINQPCLCICREYRCANILSFIVDSGRQQPSVRKDHGPGGGGGGGHLPRHGRCHHLRANGIHVARWQTHE